MSYRQSKGRKFEIYIRRYASPFLIGIGEFVCRENIWIVLHHGVMKAQTSKFKVKGRFIYGNQCEYRPVNKDTALESEG